MQFSLGLGLGLTNECNLSCPHCYRDAGGVQRISLEQVRAILGRLPVRSANGGAWLGKAYRLRGFWDGIAELCLGVYALCGLWLFVHSTHYLIVPFLVIYTLGFMWVGSLTTLQALLAARSMQTAE